MLCRDGFPRSLKATLLSVILCTLPAVIANGAPEPVRDPHADDGSREVFDPRNTHEIRLTIPGSSWAPIDDEAWSGCVAGHRD